MPDKSIEHGQSKEFLLSQLDTPKKELLQFVVRYQAG